MSTFNKSVIIECDYIATLFEHLPEVIDHSTLIIFDVDYVLLRPKGFVGGSQWFEHVVQQKIDAGLDRKAAFSEVLNICIDLQQHIVLELVEELTASVVQRIQKSSAKTIALTSRGPQQATHTLKQLELFGINFLSTGFDIKDAASTMPYCYQNGIIFCHAYCKAKALIEIITQQGYCPHRVIFVDDFLKNLNLLEKALKEFDPAIEFIGVHYTHIEKHGKPFDQEAAEYEFQQLSLARGAK